MMKISISKLKLERVISRTENSGIFQMRDEDNNRSIVIKDGYKRETVLNERAILCKIADPNKDPHPHIITYFGAHSQPYIPRLFLECMDISLKKILKENTLLNEDLENNSGPARARQLQIARGIAAGLYYLHQNGIVHRDIKPGNIMLNLEDEVDEIKDVKIIDFGMSVDISEGTSGIDWCGGTYRWVSPEIAWFFLMGSNLQLTLNEPFKIDIWSFGQILLQLTCNTSGGTPYPGYDDDQATPMLAVISRGNHGPIPDRKPVTRLITWCLNYKSEKRPDAKEVNDELNRLKLEF